jgi:ATP-dependent Lhr-like helicase
MDPRRKSAAVDQTPATSLRKRAAARTTAGRWSLLCDPTEARAPHAAQPHHGGKSEDARAVTQQAAIAAARQTAAALDAHARILLCRYGVLFRELLTRESNAPKWRDLLPILRRLEARGEIRGGRFVTGFSGEQFALPQAVESLRATRNQDSQHEIPVAAADPMNLAGIVIPGDRVPAIPGKQVIYRNGTVATESIPKTTPAPRLQLPTLTLPPTPTADLQPLRLF